MLARLQKGKYCGVCMKVWFPHDNDMVCCDHCNLWIHADCDVEGQAAVEVGARPAALHPLLGCAVLCSAVQHTVPCCAEGNTTLRTRLPCVLCCAVLCCAVRCCLLWCSVACGHVALTATRHREPDCRAVPCCAEV